jgi:Zn-dependent oligopeptidase
MTVRDKQTLRAQLHIELEDAESSFAYQREQVAQLSQGLRSVIDTLQANCDLDPSADSFDADANLEHRLSPSCQSILNYAALLKALDGLKRARQNLFNVRQRKTALIGRL